MRMADPEWQLYRSFLAAVRTGSLSGAARQLGLTQPTLGRQIAELEQALGLSLFTRSPQGLVPTEAARTILPQAEAMDAAARALVRAASGAADDSQGTIRLTAPVFMSGEVLPPMLAAFMGEHRGIVIEMLSSNTVEDLLRRDADLAVRTARPTQSALVAKRVGAMPIGFYAHRDYLARHGAPRELADIAGHTVIGFDRDDTIARGIALAGRPITREMFQFRTDADLVQFAAIRDGVGIGGAQVGVARRYRDLVRVLPAMTLTDLEIWLVMHEDLRHDRRVRLLFDHLDRTLTAYVAERD